MSISIPDDDHLAVSYVDQRVAIDAIARLDDDPPVAPEVTLSRFDAPWSGVYVPSIAFDAHLADTSPMIGYAIPPALPV